MDIDTAACPTLDNKNWIGAVPVCNAEGPIGNHDVMGFCTVIFPLECEGWNEGFDFFECYDVFEKPCLRFMV